MREYWIVYDSETGAERWRSQGAVGDAQVQVLEDGLSLMVVPAAAVAGAEIDLGVIREGLAMQVDIAADAMRSRFITNTPGQMATYLEKEAEARRVLAGEDAATVFLTAEAFAIGVTVAELAQEVVAQADMWRPIGARIEAARRKAKVDLAGAGNLKSIADAARIDWQAVVSALPAS